MKYVMTKKLDCEQLCKSGLKSEQLNEIARKMNLNTLVDGFIFEVGLFLPTTIDALMELGYVDYFGDEEESSKFKTIDEFIAYKEMKFTEIEENFDLLLTEEYRYHYDSECPHCGSFSGTILTAESGLSVKHCTKCESLIVVHERGMVGEETDLVRVYTNKGGPTI